MTLNLDFVYYRNFRFDGKLHVRCSGPDLHKVNRIRYELERAGPDGPVSFKGVSAYSQARSGKLSDHGCPATLVAEEAAGVYSIRPRVVLLDEHARAMNRPTGAAGVIDMPPLVLDIQAEEINRSVLDKVPLSSTDARRKRDVAPTVVPELLAQALPVLAPGVSCPTLIVVFSEGGHARLLNDLEPTSGSVLVRYWPNLKTVLMPRPVLSEQERDEHKLEALRDCCLLDQPASMLNDTYIELLKTLSALDYVQNMHFLPPVAPPNIFVLGIAGLIATVLTGAAVVAGNRAHENATATPDFEARQTYLDQPGPRWQGLNVRKAWTGDVTGKGSRIHFSDEGLHARHEDLRDNPNLKIVSIEPQTYADHGTASVGLILAARNGFGATGISHDSELYVYNHIKTDAQGSYQALKDLLRNVEPGDIVGINRQTAHVSVLSTMLPALHDKLWWSVMKQLAQRGAVVVNAAANGSNQTIANKGTRQSEGVDLSNWSYFQDHGDAGVILVGACRSYDGKPHLYSNHHYPYRMLNAWGDRVVTLSYSDLQDFAGSDRDYTATYGGTSSATPMVCGALSLIQSYAMQHHHIYLNGNQMHQLVMQSGYDDATLPDTDVLPMGARPNVHGALVLLDHILGGGVFEA